MRCLRFLTTWMLAILITGNTTWGCLWDYDTLQMERARFPETLELITGKFLRHSRAFYLWRIEDRLRRLETDSDHLRFLDDLAVAYDKTGQHGKAVETMQKKEKIEAGGYETYANLGTFYIHSGQFSEGLKYIKQAIAINPDAHFGREVYQQRMIEYVLSKRVEGTLPFPLSSDARTIGVQPGFAAFLLMDRELNPGQQKTEIGKAIQGVLGMMRFGQYDSPVLLEALGDLLLADLNEDAKRLAARAYLKAAYEVPGAETKEAYRRIAQETLKLQTVTAHSTTELQLDQLETQFQTELAEADRWYDDVRNSELEWIEAGVDVDAAFTRKYYAQPSMTAPSGYRHLAVVAATLICVSGSVTLLARRLRRRRASKAE
jgi:tetratricopeptide (TPR) repeat protein